LDASRLERALGANGGLGARLLQRRAQRVRELAQQYSAANGSIAAGIRVGPVVNKSIKVTSTNPHTRYVNDGTRPHTIRPRRPGGVLAFQVGGRTVFARLVHHPGFRGTHFLERALRDARV
jgi:hypothetical protein